MTRGPRSGSWRATPSGRASDALLRPWRCRWRRCSGSARGGDRAVEDVRRSAAGVLRRIWRALQRSISSGRRKPGRRTSGKTVCFVPSCLGCSSAFISMCSGREGHDRTEPVRRSARPGRPWLLPFARAPCAPPWLPCVCSEAPDRERTTLTSSASGRGGTQ